MSPVAMRYEVSVMCLYPNDCLESSWSCGDSRCWRVWLSPYLKKKKKTWKTRGYQILSPYLIIKKPLVFIYINPKGPNIYKAK